MFIKKNQTKLDLIITSSFSKTFVYASPHVNAKPAFSKISTVESVFETSALVAQNAVYVWTQLQNGGKNLRFRKYPHTRDGLHNSIECISINVCHTLNSFCRLRFPCFSLIQEHARRQFACK